MLQGHIDMVCEKNNDVVHDFYQDPLKLVRQGEWLKVTFPGCCNAWVCLQCSLGMHALPGMHRSHDRNCAWVLSSDVTLCIMVRDQPSTAG